MSVNTENINNHPVNRAAKTKMDRMGISYSPDSANIISIIETLVAIHGLPYKRFEDYLIKSYIDKLSYRLDREVMDFLLYEVESDYVEQFCKGMESMDDEIEIRDYILDELLIPAIEQEYDGVFIKNI